MNHLIDFFSEYGLSQKSSGYHRFKNPLDPTTRHKNAVVNFNFNFVEDHKMGYRSSIAAFVADVKGWTMEEANSFVGIISTNVFVNVDDAVVNFSLLRSLTSVLPVEYTELTDNSFMGERCRTYWQSRGMNVDILSSKGWGFCGDGFFSGRTIIPYKVMGKTVYFTARTFIDSDPKYLFPSTEKVGIGKSRLVYNHDALYKYDSGFIVEGAVDAECVGDNCIALGGWKMSENQIAMIRKSRWKRLDIIPDKGFELKAYAAGLYFKDIMDVYIHRIPDGIGKDVNEVGIKNIIFSDKKI